MLWRRSRLEWAGLLLLIVLLLSTVPFYPLRTAEQLSDSLADFWSFTIEPPILQTILERCVLLLPLGFLGAVLLQGRSLRLAVSGLVLGAFLLALGLELSQLPFAARHARSSDALIAFWSLLAGAVLGLMRDHADARVIRAAVLASAAAVVGLSSLALTLGPSTANWSCGFPVVAGDERTRDRPWHGAIAGIALYPAGLSDGAIASLWPRPFTPAAEDARKALGASWVYSGEDDGGRSLRPLLPWRDGVAGLPLPGYAEADKVRFCDTVRRAGALTVELRVRPDVLDQYGPARILSFSKSTLQRNFTIGQVGGSYDFRVRTLASGANGAQIPVQSRDGTVRLRWQHVIARYARGAATLDVDGTRVAGPVQFSTAVRTDPQHAAPALMLYLTLLASAAALLWLERKRL